MSFVLSPRNMDYPADISIKVEKDDFERDSNDNYEPLQLDVSVKVENEAQTKDHQDWCIPGLGSPGDLLEPLFFKKLADPEAVKCAFCYRYFSDSKTILQHNITHLRVLIRNPKLFQCEKCSTYFTNRHKINQHIQAHLRIATKRNSQYGLTYMLSYKPKAYIQSKTDLPFNSRYGKTYVPKPNTTQGKLKDGMTNRLKYKPKSYKKGQTLVDHECHICKKVLPYKSWHAHLREVHGEGGYFCALCRLEFKCERYFLKHMKKRHTDETGKTRKVKKTPTPCDECETVLQSKYALKTHKRNVHSKGEHVCSICDSKLKCNSYLLAHMRRVHYDDGKMHFCECGKKFRSPRYLKVHKKNAHSKK